MKKQTFRKKVAEFLKHIRNPENEFGFLVCMLHKKFYPDVLPANIYVDDGNYWIDLDDKKIILFQTDKKDERNWDKIIPMTIEDDPQILVEDAKIELDDSELGIIKEIVRKHQKDFIDLSNNKIDHIEFFKRLNLERK